MIKIAKKDCYKGIKPQSVSCGIPAQLIRMPLWMCVANFVADFITRSVTAIQLHMPHRKTSAKNILVALDMGLMPLFEKRSYPVTEN